MIGKSNESWLIVGLGNPGKEYERTRHNAGFRAIDILASKLGCKIDKAKFQGLYGQVNYEGKSIFKIVFTATLAEGFTADGAKGDDFRKAMYSRINEGCKLTFDGGEGEQVWGYWPEKASQYSAARMTLFYTVLITPDNKRITVPNGSLMNSNVVDYSAEELRRVDLSFSCAKGEDPRKVQEIMLGVMTKYEKILQEGDKAPFARLSGGTNDSMQFAARAWCENAAYWDVYFDLTQGITEALGAAGVQAPAFRVVSDK